MISLEDWLKKKNYKLVRNAGDKIKVIVQGESTPRWVHVPVEVLSPIKHRGTKWIDKENV